MSQKIFPRFNKHADVTCFHCSKPIGNGTDADEGKPINYGFWRGKYGMCCETCKLRTYYDTDDQSVFFDAKGDVFTPIKLFADMAPFISSLMPTGRVVAVEQLLPSGNSDRVYVATKNGSPMYIDKSWLRKDPPVCSCGDPTPYKQWQDTGRGWPECPTCGMI